MADILKRRGGGLCVVILVMFGLSVKATAQPLTWSTINEDALMDAPDMAYDYLGSAGQDLEPVPTPPTMRQTSECMPVITNSGIIYVDYITNQPLKPRHHLNETELQSSTVSQAVTAAANLYMRKSNGSATLNVTSLTDGCRESLAGELFFMMFIADETIHCDTSVVNATCTTDIVQSVECRARVHLSVSKGWYPFYTSCHSHEFFDINRRKLGNVYALGASDRNMMIAWKCEIHFGNSNSQRKYTDSGLIRKYPGVHDVGTTILNRLSSLDNI